jgi:hypothetical protein
MNQIRTRLSATAAIAVVFVVAFSAMGYAQEASLEGAMTDATGAALPGVSLTARHVATGNVFTTVAGSGGEYRFGTLRAGVYKITGELQGFATIVKENIELLVGQHVVLNLRMDVSSVAETVTVTGDAPLVDLTRSQLGGNIDPRQMQDVPVNGRNWLELSALAPGARGNSISNAPVPRDNGAFQLNLDGQQVTSIISASSFGEPQFSRDAIGEFQFITNRFDATQGRSYGVQVNAVTKSGTNKYAGSVFGYFRDDMFNSADFIVHRVLPYSDQQVGGTVGGPIVKDRLHFFGDYEYERRPNSITFTSPYPGFNIPDLLAVVRQNKAAARIDAQFNTRTRLTVRGTRWDMTTPDTQTGGATSHPSTASFNEQSSDQLVANLTHTVTDKTVNELKAGYVSFHLTSDCYYPSISITLRGYSIGCPANFPQTGGQSTYSIRDDFTHYGAWKGQHEVKIGAEYLRTRIYFFWALNSRGALQADNGPIPSNIQQLFPVWNDPSTWNLTPLSPISVRFRQAFGNFNILVPISTAATWVQDNWSVTKNLTLNLGLRYDFDKGSLTEDASIPPFFAPHGAVKDNIAPRAGFAYAVNDHKTVIRGGVGKFFAQITNNQSLVTEVTAQTAIAGIQYDRRSDFASNPWNGRPPSVEQARLQPQDLRLLDPTATTPYAYQTSVGFQHELSRSSSIQSDYVYTGTRNDFYLTNINMSFNPATGVNFPFSVVSSRPYPTFGTVAEYHTGGYSNYNGLQTAWTKRFSQHWQASATYTLSKLMDTGTPYSFNPDNSFNPFADYAPAVGDQRHRFVFNGIWSLPHDFQISGLYFFGSGEHFNNTYGGDLRNTGGWSAGRLRPDGTIVPRDSFVGLPIHRVDMRLSRRFRLLGSVAAEGMFEVFNLFNHQNFGSYVTTESNKAYAQPQQSTALEYQPRMLQLGFRVIF